MLHRIIEKVLHPCQRLLTDVMLDPFRVNRGDFRIHADGAQKTLHKLVPGPATTRQSSSLFGENNGLPRLGDHEPFAVQASNDLERRHVTHPEDVGQSSDAADAIAGDHVGNRFDVVFRGFGRMIIPRALKTLTRERFGHRRFLRDAGLKQRVLARAAKSTARATARCPRTKKRGKTSRNASPRRMVISGCGAEPRERSDVAVCVVVVAAFFCVEELEHFQMLFPLLTPFGTGVGR